MGESKGTGEHFALECFEGEFVPGQASALISKVTDPRNFAMIGVPIVDTQILAPQPTDNPQ